MGNCPTKIAEQTAQRVARQQEEEIESSFELIPTASFPDHDAEKKFKKMIWWSWSSTTSVNHHQRIITSLGALKWDSMTPNRRSLLLKTLLHDDTENHCKSPAVRSVAKSIPTSMLANEEFMTVANDHVRSGGIKPGTGCGSRSSGGWWSDAVLLMSRAISSMETTAARTVNVTERLLLSLTEGWGKVDRTFRCCSAYSNALVAMAPVLPQVREICRKQFVLASLKAVSEECPAESRRKVFDLLGTGVDLTCFTNSERLNLIESLAEMTTDSDDFGRAQALAQLNIYRSSHKSCVQPILEALTKRLKPEKPSVFPPIAELVCQIVSTKSHSVSTRVKLQVYRALLALPWKDPNTNTHALLVQTLKSAQLDPNGPNPELHNLVELALSTFNEPDTMTAEVAWDVFGGVDILQVNPITQTPYVKVLFQSVCFRLKANCPDEGWDAAATIEQTMKAKISSLPDEAQAKLTDYLAKTASDANDSITATAALQCLQHIHLPIVAANSAAVASATLANFAFSVSKEQTDAAVRLAVPLLAHRVTNAEVTAELSKKLRELAKQPQRASIISFAVVQFATKTVSPPNWGAVPDRVNAWTRPADLGPAHIIADVWHELWHQHHGVPPSTAILHTWNHLADGALRVLEVLVEAIRNSRLSREVLNKVFAKERKGSLAKYESQLHRISLDPNKREYEHLSDRLRAALQPRLEECCQSSKNYPELATQAVTLKPQFDAFVKMLAKKTGSIPLSAPIKGPWRALEKMVLQSQHQPGQGVETLDASKLCDCLRGAIQCSDFASINTVLELLTYLDNDLGEPDRVEEIEQRFRIRLIRAKCRFSQPTSGGWADLLINFRFLDDPSNHVAELQIQHAKLLLVRKEGNAHVKYNIFRSAFEILETVGEAPVDELEECQPLKQQENTFLNNSNVVELKKQMDQQLKAHADEIRQLKEARGRPDVAELKMWMQTELSTYECKVRQLEEQNRLQRQELQLLKKYIEEVTAAGVGVGHLATLLNRSRKAGAGVVEGC